jgi:hypothetical protein
MDNIGGDTFGAVARAIRQAWLARIEKLTRTFLHLFVRFVCLYVYYSHAVTRICRGEYTYISPYSLRLILLFANIDVSRYILLSEE